jgi:hypothetical protein
MDRKFQWSVCLHRVENLEEVSHAAEVGIHVKLGLVQAEGLHALLAILDMLGHYFGRNK